MVGVGRELSRARGGRGSPLLYCCVFVPNACVFPEPGDSLKE